MNQIITLLTGVSGSFGEISIYIQQKDTLYRTSRFLQTLHISENPRTFLALWMLYKFPVDTMGHNYDEILYKNCENIFKYKKVHLITSTIILFKSWKIKDNIALKNELFHSYHNLSIVLLNTTDEHRENITKCRENILKNAEKLGGNAFVTKIKQYKPVVLNLYDLEQISEKAFWDVVKKNYISSNYEWVYMILDHICCLFKVISPSNSAYYDEILDIPFIKQQVEHNVYTNMQNLTYKLLEIVESFQAPVQDSETAKIKALPFDLITLLKEIVTRSENIIKMIFTIKNNIDIKNG